jgi:hypothetical protein
VAEAKTSGERAPAAIESLVKQLLVTYKAVKLYPPTSTIPRENAREVVSALRLQLRERSGVRLVVTRDGLFFESLPILPGQPAFASFAREFYGRRLSDVRFHAGVSEEEVTAFLGVLLESPEDIESAGGFEARLWERQVDGITVSAVSTKIVDAEIPEALEELPVSAEPWPPDTGRIDELLGDRFGIKPREQRLLVRFVANPKLLNRYLTDVALARAASGPASALAERIATMSRLANGELAEDRHALFRSIAEAVMGLDPETRHQLLVDRLLADARIDDAIAEVIRQLDLNEVCSALAEGLGPDPVSRDGISRALRNLALISMAAKDEVSVAAQQALTAAGLAAPEVDQIIEQALPTHIHVMRKNEEPRDTEIDSVLKLIDLAPSRDLVSDESDPELRELREEALANVSDGEVIASLVTLATLERRPDVFGSILANVEDNLSMLIEWGDFEIAADAATALYALSNEDGLAQPQRERVLQVLNGLAEPKQIRLIARAMRVFSADSPEHATCRRLLNVLGGQTIDSLLEVLADEPDMSARKALVDLVTDLAPGHVQRLGERVSDSRWYFVRNVVSILGSTHGADTLPYLGRTLRHNDARVRRETIRALSNIRDRMADEMLAASLGDSDAQNVQLAARYLGIVGARGAAQALMAVARGDGRGNRDVPPRVEAIEALGRMGATEAIPLLNDLAGRRAIIRSGRVKEIRAAAESALAAISAASNGGV